jgi:hypothetical protein
MPDFESSELPALPRTWPFGASVAVLRVMMARIHLCVLIALAALALAPTAGAGDDRIALGEVSVATPAPGLDDATVKTTAEHEIKSVDVRKVKRRVVVSVAVHGSDAPIALTVNATLRDRKSGNMLAVIEGRARADGEGSARVRRAVLRAAVRSAVRQIPEALSED